MQQQQTGAIVRREATVAEFTTASSEAVLDIWGIGCRELPDLLVDVTVRHPAAERYHPSAVHKPGHAAALAEEEKQARGEAGRCGNEREPWGYRFLKIFQKGVEIFLEICPA